MKARITVLTLAVSDLERAVAFYRDGLGLHTAGVVGAEYPNGAVAFFKLDGGLRLALWPRTSLAADAGLPLDPPSATEVLIAHNVDSEAEVRAVIEQAAAAGAKIVRPAQPTFWGGYGGYFLDPDGHLWEVVFNRDFDSLA
jgi:hypothetical protein